MGLFDKAFKAAKEASAKATTVVGDVKTAVGARPAPGAPGAVPGTGTTPVPPAPGQAAAPTQPQPQPQSIAPAATHTTYAEATVIPASAPAPELPHYQLVDPYDLATSVPIGQMSSIIWMESNCHPHTFTLQGETFEVTEGLDRYNQCFAALLKQSEKSAQECFQAWSETIVDFPALWENYGRIFDEHLFPTLKLGHDMVLAEDLYHIPFDQFVTAYKTSGAFASLELYQTIIKSIAEVGTSNAAGKFMAASLLSALGQAAIDGVSVAAAHRGRGGALIAGAMEGLGLTDGVREGIDEWAHSDLDMLKDTALTQEQQVKIYELFCQSMLPKLDPIVRFDYARVISTVAQIMHDEQVPVWLPDADAVEKADLTFQNLSPQIPAPKLARLCLRVLAANPYNPRIHEFMAGCFGKTDEVVQLRAYFEPSPLKNAVAHGNPMLIDDAA